MSLHIQILVTEKTTNEKLIEYAKTLLRIAGHDLEPAKFMNCSPAEQESKSEAVLASAKMDPPETIIHESSYKVVSAPVKMAPPEKKSRAKKEVVSPVVTETVPPPPPPPPPATIDYLYVLDKLSDLTKAKTMTHEELTKILNSLNIESFVSLQSETEEVLTNVLSVVDEFLKNK